jgi:hypothetical protein
MANRTSLILLLAVCIGLTATTLATDAQAFIGPNSQSGAVTQIEYTTNNSTSPTMNITLSTGSVFSASTASQCSGGLVANSTDTIGKWMALAQGALLSGQNITISFNQCSSGGTMFIFDIVIQ